MIYDSFDSFGEWLLTNRERMDEIGELAREFKRQIKHSLTLINPAEIKSASTFKRLCLRNNPAMKFSHAFDKTQAEWFKYKNR